MKKCFLKLIVFSLLMAGILPLSAQDFNIKVLQADSVFSSGSKCTVELSITGGLSPYIYLLYENEPWKGGKLIEKTSALTELSHTFTISAPGRYFIGATDSNDQTKLVIIQIKASGTTSAVTISDANHKEYFM